MKCGSGSSKRVGDNRYLLPIGGAFKPRRSGACSVMLFAACLVCYWSFKHGGVTHEHMSAAGSTVIGIIGAVIFLLRYSRSAKEIGRAAVSGSWWGRW